MAIGFGAILIKWTLNAPIQNPIIWPNLSHYGEMPSLQLSLHTTQQVGLSLALLI